MHRFVLALMETEQKPRSCGCRRSPRPDGIGWRSCWRDSRHHHPFRRIGDRGGSGRLAPLRWRRSFRGLHPVFPALDRRPPPRIPAPTHLTTPTVPTDQLPAVAELCREPSSPQVHVGGATTGRKLLHQSVSGAVRDCDRLSDALDADATSHLSPYLHSHPRSATAGRPLRSRRRSRPALDTRAARRRDPPSLAPRRRPRPLSRTDRGVRGHVKNIGSCDGPPPPEESW